MKIVRWSAIVFLLFAFTGCSKSIQGTYATASGDELTLTSNDNWVMKNGTAGTYKVDGNLLILSGLPFGMSLTGTLSGDTITVNDHNIMTGKPISILYIRKK